MKTNLYHSGAKAFMLFAIALLINNKSFAQVNQTFNGGNDTTICLGASTTLNAFLDTTGIIPNVVFGLHPDGTITSTDDGWSGVVPLPFPFNYYGITYNSCIIGSNNDVSFNIANAGFYNTWPIPTTPFPQTTPADLQNTIMGPWQDIYPGAFGAPFPGIVQYATYGTSPNRIFFVEYVNVPMFSCFTDNCFADQIQIFESGGIIETHIESKTVCSTWNSGKAVHGVQNATGTIAAIVPGRNANDPPWSTYHEGTMFTPSATNYTITPVAYTPIITHATSNVTWYANGNPVGNGWTLNVSPTTTTTYIAQIRYGTGLSCDTTSAPLYLGAVTVTVVPAYTVTTSAVDVLCFGGTGSATINPGGGQPPYNYLWNPSSQTTQTATNLAAGTYNVTVTDVLGCSVDTTITVNGPLSALAAVINPPPTNVTCNGGSDGSVTVAASGGTAGYGYVWTSSSGTVGTTSTVSGLPAGAYHVDVTDANGCTTSLNTFIGQPLAITASIPTPTDVSCFGANDGSATVNAAGGTGVLNYVWTDAGGNVVGNSATASGLAAGTYTVTVTDGNGCVQTASTVIAPAVAVSASITSPIDVSCFGGSNGSLTVVPNGGAGGYVYVWTNSSSVVVGNGATASGLPAGGYTVTVTDLNGCIQTASWTVNEPSAVAASVNLPTTDVSCFGGNNGSATVTASGGTGTLNYVWTNSSSVVVGNAATASGLPAGVYTVSVTDANGCNLTTTATIIEPSALAFNITGTVDVLCNGGNNGSAIVGGSGGTGTYNYAWTQVSTGNVVGNNATATGLPAGNYFVTVSDANGCSTVQNATIYEPTAVTLSVLGGTTICIGQNAIITAIGGGGVAPLNYVWDNLSLDSIQTVAPTITTPYTVTVTDANGCSPASQTVTVAVNPPLNVNALATSSICFGSSASISASGGGGNGGPYSYSWNGGAITSANATVIPDHDSTFTVEVSDGCSPPVQTAVTVIVNALPVASFAPVSAMGCPPLGVSFSDSSITPSGSNYYWNFGDGFSSSTQSPSHVYSQTGVYDVSLIVRSAQGCLDTLTVQNAITVLNVPTAMFAMSDEQISMYNAVVNFTDLSSGAVWQNWDFGDGIGTSDSLNPIYRYTDAGTYTIRLIVENSVGCFDTTYSVLRVNNEITLYVPTGFTPNGDGINDNFQGYGIGISEYSLSVFDRWGSQVFHSDNKDIPWNGLYNSKGEICPNDVYVYKIKYTDVDGVTHEHVGHVALTR